MRLIFWSFLLTSIAWAQAGTEPPLRLSLRQAVDIALAPDGAARVKLAREAVEQAETRRLQARAALLPNLDGAISQSSQTRNLKAFGIQFPTIPIPGFVIPTFVGPFDVFDARASVTQSAFDFATIRRYQASRMGLSAAKAENDNARDQVTETVARAYLAGLRAQVARDTARQNVELSEALLRLAQSQKAAGTGTGIEVTRAQVQLANDRQRLLVTETDLHSALLTLLRVMGLEPDRDVELTDQLAYVPTETASVERALKVAHESRADLKAQQERESTARLNYSAVKWERAPSVAAFADYGSSGAGIDNSVPTRTYGISVRIPLFDGGRRDARRAESLSQYRQEQIRTKDLEYQVELEVRTALDNIRSAEGQIAAAKEGLALAESELVQAQRRYKAGVANSIEVTDAQTRLVRAQDNQLSALYNCNLARINLEASMGTLEAAVARGR